jgi:hypothetical protein
MKTSLALLMTVSLLAASAAAKKTAETAGKRETVAKIAERIRKADYEGDRDALAKLANEMTPWVQEAPPLASRALYWRGFALWRRALNGFNEKADAKELEKDLSAAASDFTDASAKDPGFADSRPAAASCLFSLGYLAREDKPRMQDYVTRGIALMAEGNRMAPENPRLLWVQGGGHWYVASQRGEPKTKAFETYNRGLENARRLRGSVQDPLDPAWGEPELLMSLAWSHLNDEPPDLDAAESEARAALALVPNWHYVRDVLLPQIRDAKKAR